MYRTFVKRLLDIVSALLLLIILALPLVLIAAWIQLFERIPFLFKHQRAGKDLKPFTCYKFRSMKVEAPPNVPTNSFSNAHAYITRTGKVMRKLSLDELPQLINVLRGDMSIVGPRPVIVNELKLLKEREKYNANSVKPGLTGLAQVNGRDEVRIKQKAKMDGEYVEKFGILMDMKCLFKTVWAVLSISGHKEGHEEADAAERRAQRYANEDM